VRGVPDDEVGHIRPLADYPYNRRLATDPQPIIFEVIPGEEQWIAADAPDTVSAACEKFRAAGLKAGFHNHKLEFVAIGDKHPMQVLAANTPKDFTLQLDVGTCVEAGVDPVLVARQIYDSNSMGKLKLTGAVLNAMQLDPTGRIAILYLDDEVMRLTGSSSDDTEGLINMPLSVKDIATVVFFRQTAGHEYRVSMRSKGDIDIAAVAKQFGGGGHKNAAGCTATGSLDALQKLFVDKIEQAIDGRPVNRR
jgi:hypothetical protein